MWADKDTNIDYINYTETAEIAVEIIKDKNLHPLSLGVFGGWGAGKSSMLQLIRKELEGEPTENSEFIVIDFDAWLFQNYDDARASLMEVISRELIAHAKENTCAFEKAKGLLKRVNYLRAIGTSVELGASLALGIPPMGMFKRGLDAISGLLSEDAVTGEDLNEFKTVAKAGRECASSLITPEDNTPPQQIIEFRTHFAEVLRVLDKTLVVFIDNLDRCLPDVAIETLEAIRLFLFLDSTVFIIAADEDMIRASVKKHYDGIDSNHITDYLDKLIQVPMRVPLLGIQEVQAYITLLFIASDQNGIEYIDDVQSYLNDKLVKSWMNDRIKSSDIIDKFKINSDSLKSSVELAERLAPILTSAPNISGNPRIIKRLLNTIQIRCRLATKRRMPVDETLLTKLAVFERCTSDKSYEILAKKVLEHSEGKPPLLSELEEICENEKEFEDKLPKDWKPSKGFLMRWFKLSPSLSDLDLRPAVYLSKESSRLTSLDNHLGKQGQKLLDALKNLTRGLSRSGKELAELCPEDLQSHVMRELINEIRKANNWSSPPTGFYGAVLLANVNTVLGDMLVRFLDNLPPKTVGSWAFPLIQKTAWGKDAAEHWKDSEDSPIKSFKLKK